MNAGSICLSRYLGHYSWFENKKKSEKKKEKEASMFLLVLEKKMHSLYTEEVDKARIKMLIQILHQTGNHSKFSASPTHCHTEH